MNTHAIILFAHGARDPQWAVPFEQLAANLASRADRAVRLAYLELMTPNLADCVAALVDSGTRAITIVPAFMARGAHLRRDLPALVEELDAQYPDLCITVTEALGEAAPIQAAMADWIMSQAT
jgi:sirohydrochlorin cobaltochelatase